MYHVVIADDEQNIREAIVMQVQWEKLGFCIVGQAENGAEALELVGRLVPDLLITDIKMPFISGMELAKQVRMSHPGIDIVFLTGYDDFEYTKQAIKYNAADYWLKPISIEDITLELSNLRIKLDQKWETLKSEQLGLNLLYQNKRLAKDNFLVSLVLDKKHFSKLETQIRLMGPEFFGTDIFEQITRNPGNFQMFSIELEGEEKGKYLESSRNITENLLRQYLAGETFVYDGKIHVLISDTEENMNRAVGLLHKDILQSIRRILGVSVSMGVSNVYHNLDLSYMAYREAVGALHYTDGSEVQIVYINDIEKDSDLKLGFLNNIISTLDEKIKLATPKEVDEYIKEVFAGFKEKKLSRSDFNVCVLEMISLVYRSARSVIAESSFNSKLVDGLFFNNSYEEIEQQLGEMCVGACQSITGQRQKNADIIASKAMDMIQNQFGDSGLSLNVLSEQLHCSSNYLSALIKKVHGESFINLLTKRRMEYARDQLLCSNLKIFEIAVASGYVDQHYFSYCFKKYYGVSPNKIRESVANEKNES